MPDALSAAALADWLRDAVPGTDGVIGLEKFPRGQSNPTFRVTVDGAPRFVVRKQPDGDLLPSAHAVDREYRVMAALGDAGLAVPTMHALCEDRAVIGTKFYVMDYVAGRVFWDMRLPDCPRAERAAIYREVARVLAALHAVDPASVGLADFGREGNYFARQIGRWTRQYRASETEEIPAMERLIAWLPENIPATNRARVIHGDYKLDNLVFHPVEPRIVAVLDWELSTLGDPLADLAYLMMAWRLPPEPLHGIGGVDFAALGIPDEGAMIACYCDAAGIAVPARRDWEFAIAYNMFRIAAIRQGILKRALAGNASSADAVLQGEKGRDMAQIAWAHVERVFGG